MQNSVQETLDALKGALSAPIPEAIAKAFTQSTSATTGLTYYDLEAPAKTLYPVLTPLRNRIPRVSGRGGIQANWKAVTGVNINGLSLGVAEGKRGGVSATTVQEFLAAYRGLGLEDTVTFEADYAAEGFEDVKARATQGLLRAVMIGEEKLILGGNTSLALGQTATPSLSASNSGGALATSTLSVIAVGLTLEGYLAASVSGGVNGQVSRNDVLGQATTYGGGSAKPSANATVSVTGPAGSVAATVANQTGAVAYAWYWGAAGSETLGAITTINSVSITANAAGTQTAAQLGTSDNSKNSLVFDGLLSQVFNPASNAYSYKMATGTAGTGTPLTADGQGGVVEIDAVLKYLWDNFRLSSTDIYVSSQEQKNISSKILQGNANTAMRFNINAEQGAIGGGVMVRSYLNKFSMDGAQEIPIRLHPNMPSGTILFYTDVLPYPLSNVSNVLQIRARRDYYQIEWPLRTRQYEYGVYADEVLQNYAPFSFATITNIANG